MNSLSETVMVEMQEIFKEVQSRPEVKAVVLMSAKTGSFIAGADINMLAK
jgi:enoyl-CoA hydratase/carnithine racemase